VIFGTKQRKRGSLQQRSCAFQGKILPETPALLISL
jgi:hypothetical protein